MVAQWLYRDSILTAVAMSGRVDVASHCRHLVSCCILWVILACVVESYVFLGILSIGYPERYSVGHVPDSGPSRPAFTRTVSMKAS